MTHDPRARMYLVRLRRKGIEETRETLAYDATDARVQVWLSYDEDPHIELISIEPAKGPGAEIASADPVTQRLDRIIELLEGLTGITERAAEEAELATHSAGCKCGRC